MSDPVTAALIIGGSLITGFAAKNQADAKAKGLKLQAERENQVAEAEAKRFDKRESAKLSAARANRAASGVQFTGSPLIVDEDQVEEIALNRANIINTGQVRAQRLRESAQATKVGGRLALFTTIISGATKASSVLNSGPPPPPGDVGDTGPVAKPATGGGGSGVTLHTIPILE